jgi:hypothetical protein
MSKHRNTSLRFLLSLLTAFVLLLGSTSSIFAQATPDASPTAGGAGPALGDAVVLSDSSGDPALQVAVTTLTDPDKAVQNSDRGFHWIGIEVVVNNPTSADIEFNAYSISVVDEQGFIYYGSYGSRDSDDTTARPDFNASTVPAGGSVSGWLFYQLINDATPAWIIFNDSFSTQQFVVLANLEGQKIADGDKVTFYDANAEEVGNVSVDQIITDFQKSDSSITPNRGMTAVGVLVTITNTGTADLDAGSATFYLVDDLGFQYYPQFYFRSDASTAQYPDLPSDAITAGSSATGLISFEIPKDASVSYITFQPDYQQFYIVAQPGKGSTVSGDTLTPVAVATDDSTSDDVFDEGTPDETDDSTNGGTETGDCVGVMDWSQAVSDAATELGDLDVLSGSFEDVSPGDLRDAADKLGDLADTVDGIDHPEIANDASDATIELFQAYESALNDAADSLDNGDSPADVEAALGNDSRLTQSFTDFSSAIGELTSSCPDSGLDGILS